jgi:hypothetical protein
MSTLQYIKSMRDKLDENEQRLDDERKKSISEKEKNGKLILELKLMLNHEIKRRFEGERELEKAKHVLAKMRAKVSGA